VVLILIALLTLGSVNALAGLDLAGTLANAYSRS
jgi:hypothetical protein